MNIGHLIELSDVIGSMLGAALGFLGAYWILNLQLDAERRKAKEREIDHFKYIVSLVERSAWGWQRHVDGVKEFGSRSKDYPLEIHPHPIQINIAHQTLQRTDRFGLRTAAIQALGEERGEREQREIVTYIDGMEAYSGRLEALIVELKKDYGDFVWQFENKSFTLIRSMDVARGVHPRPVGTTSSEVASIRAAALSVSGSGTRPNLEDKFRLLVLPMLELDGLDDVDHLVLKDLMPIVRDLDLLRQRIEDKGEEIHERVQQMTEGIEDQLEGIRSVIKRLKVHHDYP